MLALTKLFLSIALIFISLLPLLSPKAFYWVTLEMVTLLLVRLQLYKLVSNSWARNYGQMRELSKILKGQLAGGKTLPYPVIFSLGSFNVTNDEQTSTILSEENGRKNVIEHYICCWFCFWKSIFWMQDVIHVVESKSAKRYGDYFLRQILKVHNPFSTFLLFVIATWLRLKRSAIRYSAF